MSHPRVVNVRRKGAEWDVYIGRGRCPRTKQPGRWGNPASFRVWGKQAMRIYLDTLHESPQRVAEARVELAGKVLGCWCAPGPCHGEVLARLADGNSLSAIRSDMLRACGLEDS